MSMSQTVKHQMEANSINYELIHHPHTRSSMETAGAAHVASYHVAKAVIVKDDDDYLMVVVPSSHHVHLGKLHQLLGEEVGLATEDELVSLFPDCEGGAIPPLGGAYKLITLVDPALLRQKEIYFESGDHENLIKVSGKQFIRLLSEAEPVEVLTHH